MAWAAAVCLAGAASASAQDGRRIYEEQLRVRLDEQIPEAREMGLDAGGWFSFSLFRFDDAYRKKHTLRQYELRAWASANLRGVHRFYFRGLTDWKDWSSSGSDPKDEYNDPDVERAWYQFDLGRMIRNQTGLEPPAGLRLKVGREYTQIGTALALSMPLDLVQIEAYSGDWELTALLGKTDRDTPNIDRSAAVASHQERCFWGLELAYSGLDRHRPFAYFLGTSDHTSPDPRSASQRYDYSPYYVGLGSTGTVVSPNLRYQAEVVGQFGKGFSAGAVDGQDSICALGADLLLEYFFPVATRPKVMFEYLFGSGDGDRGSSNSTDSGNRRGTTDNEFSAFGFRDTGLTLAPNLSNLHIFVVGAGFFPLERYELFRRMELGTKAFFYQKATSGPISDPTASGGSRWVGFEWDVYCDWRLTSDLSWTVRCGAFLPGDAYDDDACRQFLFTGLVFSF